MMLGSLLWGFGAAIGFPTGMSAAADEKAAGIHVSVVSAIGYAAFLAGPPLVGFLGDAVGIRESLLVVLVALGLALVTSAAARSAGRVEGREATRPESAQLGRRAVEYVEVGPHPSHHRMPKREGRR